MSHYSSVCELPDLRIRARTAQHTGAHRSLWLAALWFTLTITCHFQFLKAILLVGMKWYLTVDLDRSSPNLSGLVPLPDPTLAQASLSLLSSPHPHTQLDLAGETPAAPSVLISPVQTLASHPACPLLLKCFLAGSLSRHRFPTSVINPLCLLLRGLRRPPAVGLQTEQAPHRVCQANFHTASVASTQSWTHPLGPPPSVDLGLQVSIP